MRKSARSQMNTIHDPYSSPHFSLGRAGEAQNSNHDHDALFASSPARFAFSFDIRTISKDVLARRLGITELPPTTYIITSEGMRVALPVRSLAPSIDLAVLACEDRHNNLLGLVLRQTKVAHVRCIGAPINDPNFRRHSSMIITQHPSLSVHIHPLSPLAVSSFFRSPEAKKRTSLFQSIVSTGLCRPNPVKEALEGPPTTSELYIVHHRSLPVLLPRPLLPLERPDFNAKPFRILLSRHHSRSESAEPGSHAYTAPKRSSVTRNAFAVDSFSIVNATALQLVQDTPFYAFRIVGESDWTFDVKFTQTQCTVHGSDDWSTLAATTTFVHRGEEITTLPATIRNDILRDECANHVHGWDASWDPSHHSLRTGVFHFPMTVAEQETWTVTITLRLHLEHPLGNHAYPPTFSLAASVLQPPPSFVSRLYPSPPQQLISHQQPIQYGPENLKERRRVRHASPTGRARSSSLPPSWPWHRTSSGEDEFGLKRSVSPIPFKSTRFSFLILLFAPARARTEHRQYHASVVASPGSGCGMRLWRVCLPRRLSQRRLSSRRIGQNRYLGCRTASLRGTPCRRAWHRGLLRPGPDCVVIWPLGIRRTRRPWATDYATYETHYTGTSRSQWRRVAVR